MPVQSLTSDNGLLAFLAACNIGRNPSVGAVRALANANMSPFIRSGYSSRDLVYIPGEVFFGTGRPSEASTDCKLSEKGTCHVIILVNRL